jgi:hypothetical protein
VRRCVPHALVGLLGFALSACSSGPSSDGLPDDAGSDSVSDVEASASPPDETWADASTTDEASPGASTAGDTAPDAAPDNASSDVSPETTAAAGDASPEDTTTADVSPESAAPGDDATLADATLADATLADATLADATLADATLADATLADATLDDTSSDDVAPEAIPPPEASSADAGPDAAQPDASTDAPPLPDDAPAPDDAPDDATTTTDATDASLGAADAEPAAIVPTMSNGHYVFTSGALSFEVDPQIGGRIVSFAFEGQNVLTGPEANAINYGSTFWTSPQSDWNWPPLPEIDNLAYTASVDGGTLTLQGAVNAALGVAITKVFSLDAASGSVSIGYTIENAGSSARSFAPWEVTRVHPTGLMFFPTGQQAYSGDSGPALVTQQTSGATWFDADSAAVTADTKFFADAARGWLAQESGGLVFVKKFAGATLASEAPGEAEIEMFVSGDGAYVELEGQGAYQPIAAGASRSWSVTWFLARVPPTVDAGVGSGSLVAFVDGL